MNANATFRPARRDEARDIAELFQISSDGVADYVWTTLQPDYPGLSLIEIGARRYARENTDFSYENCVVSVVGGSVIGMLHSYAMADDPSPPSQDGDPVLRPYSELESPGSLYISGLALRPAFRSRGIGTTLLGIAQERARKMQLGRLSLLVFEGNGRAIRFYDRHGFKEVDRRPIVPYPLIHYTGDVLLFTAEVP